jgi:APA family basic amino acid/polyamine antiporter
LIGAIAAAMVGSIFSSDSWNNVTFIAGEIKNPKRNIGLSLFFGTLIVTLIYITANLMYLNVLPLQSIAYAENDRVAVSAANAIFRKCRNLCDRSNDHDLNFGCNNGLILAGARVYYTMAKDGLFFKKTGELNKNAVPEYALWIQCVVASLLCLSGKYGDLLTMVSFIVVIFYVLPSSAYLFSVRKTRCRKALQSIWLSCIACYLYYIAVCFCCGLYGHLQHIHWGIDITLLGIPLYYIAVGSSKKTD